MSSCVIAFQNISPQTEYPSVSPQETWIDPETFLPCPVPCSLDQTQLEEAIYFAKGRGDGETQFGRVFGS